jgi:hypothetical protein
MAAVVYLYHRHFTGFDTGWWIACMWYKFVSVVQLICLISTWIVVYTIVICKTFRNKTKYMCVYIYSNDFEAGTNFNGSMR